MQFGTFVTSIQNDANDTSSRMKTKIEAIVNDCHLQLCSERDWDFLVVEKSDNTSIAGSAVPFDIGAGIGVGGVPLPMIRVLAMADTTDGIEFPLDFTTLAEVRNNWPGYNTFSGTPRYWYYQNSGYSTNVTGPCVNVFPYIDTAATRTFVFQCVLLASIYVSGSTAPLLLPDQFLHVLRHKVMEHVWKDKTDERWQLAHDDFEESKKDMINACTAKKKIIYATRGMNYNRFPKLGSDS